jgi:hypothetical protein
MQLSCRIANISNGIMPVQELVEAHQLTAQSFAADHRVQSAPQDRNQKGTYSTDLENMLKPLSLH